MLLLLVCASFTVLRRSAQLPELHGLLQVHSCQGGRLRALQAVQAGIQLSLPQCVSLACLNTENADLACFQMAGYVAHNDHALPVLTFSSD